MTSLVAQYRALAGYNTWMNRRLYALAAGMPDEERRRDRRAFFGSIHGTLNHILLGDRTWMGRFTGDREHFTSRNAAGEAIAITSLAQELYADFDDLRRERTATDADIERWAEGLTDDDLGATMRYRTSAGAAQEHLMWWAVTHFFNHQTHHRGQVTTLFRQAGVDPGVTDLIAFLRNPSLP